jgi:sodium-dependent dicarboxylate transporter 2/3/5
VEEQNLQHQSLEEMLDLEKHKLSEVPAKRLTKSERWMKYVGFPIGIIVFLAIYYMPLPEGLTSAGQAVLACFALALVWWVTQPIPTHVTSLSLMALLIFTNGWDRTSVMGVLGYDVIWLNVLAFILASILITTNLAKRLSLVLISKFGKNAKMILVAFLLIQLSLAPLIPATTARAVMTLPLMLVAAAIYGASADKPNNFGRNLFLQNLQGINVMSSGFMTGSTANLIAVAFIWSMAGEKVYYTDWMFAALPLVLIAMTISWWIGPKFLFKMTKEDETPHIEGGMDVIKKALEKMGPMSFNEIKGAMIFGLVIFLWVTDRFHVDWFGFEINAVSAALLGVIITLLPKVGILNWNQAQIPWHLMIFSCGAYAGGLALNETKAARWVMEQIFSSLNLSTDINFWVVYVIIIAINMYSHLFFTSKTMRTIIMIPFVITFAQQMGYNPLWLALPAAFTIDWVIALPINAKPNVVLFTTGQYSVVDNFKYGIIMTTIGIILLTVFGMTWFAFLGITPGL